MNMNDRSGDGTGSFEVKIRTMDEDSEVHEYDNSKIVVVSSGASWLPCDTVWVKKVAPPLELFPIFSLVVNLCNWKLSWLLPENISMFTPILVHLSEYLYKLYHFYQ